MDSRFHSKVPLLLQSGVWSDDPVRGMKFPAGYVRRGENLLTYNGGAVSRPGLKLMDTLVAGGYISRLVRFTRGNMTGAAGGSLGSDLVLFTGGGYVLLDPDLATPQIVSETAGAGTAFVSDGITDTGYAVVNGSLVVGGEKTGGAIGLHTITYPFSTMNWTEIVGQNWRFVLGHKSRLIVASSTSASNGIYKVSWTVPGTVTDFSAFGSGTATLLDSYDAITGLASIKDQPIVCRGSGFTLMYPTGQSSPAYEFRNFTRNGRVGPKWANCLSCDGNMIFFVGDEDIFTFDSSSIAAIGKPIRKQFFDHFVQASQGYQSSILRSDFVNRRTYFVLSPRHSDATLPIYAFDIEAQTWNVWQVDQIMSTNMIDIGTTQSAYSSYESTYAFIKSGAPHSLYCFQDQGCEKEIIITWAPINPGQLKDDYRVQDIWFTFVPEGASGIATISLQGRLGKFNELVTKTVEVAYDGQADDALPITIKVNPQFVANPIEVTLTFSAGSKIRFHEGMMIFSEAGEKR